MELVKYDKAKHALAEAKNFDEVKDIRDKAEAMRAYAKQANDSELVNMASEIKVRAERKLGEMLADADLNKGGRPPEINRSITTTSLSDDNWPEPPTVKTPAPTLSEIGITKDQSSRFQKIAAIPQEHFETAVNMAKDAASAVTTAFILKSVEPIKPAFRPMEMADPDAPVPAPRPTYRTPKEQADHAMYLFGELALLTCNNILPYIADYSIPRLVKNIVPAFEFTQRTYEEVING